MGNPPGGVPEAHAQIIVIGAGPAGLAAAACAAERGRDVLLVDENGATGGRIWHGVGRGRAAHWRSRVTNARVRLQLGTSVVARRPDGALLAETARGALVLHAQRFVIATGARERFLPFPGWTLPGVFGVGGLQSLAQGGWDLTGRTVVIAGSGPLLLAVAVGLLDRGARILALAEQAPSERVRAFAASLWRWPRKLAQAAVLRARLRRVPFLQGFWPARAEGHAKLERVVLTDGITERTFPCDAFACGFGLVPNLQIPAMFECQIRDGVVATDDLLRTSTPDVWCAGEPLGIGGVETASIEGQIAGLAAAGDDSGARALLPRRVRARAFAAKLEECFVLRDELRSMPTDDTFLCRCEDVSVGRARPRSSWRDAKLQTRCGMGPCQGRVCGPAAAFLFNWRVDDARPPASCARLSTLAHLAPDPQPEPVP